MHTLQYYIGQACRRYRRGELDLTITELAKQTSVNISRLSLFENGKVSSIKPLQYYLLAKNADNSQNIEVLLDLLNEANHIYLQKGGALVHES